MEAWRRRDRANGASAPWKNPPAAVPGRTKPPDRERPAQTESRPPQWGRAWREGTADSPLAGPPAPAIPAPARRQTIVVPAGAPAFAGGPSGLHRAGTRPETAAASPLRPPPK